LTAPYPVGLIGNGITRIFTLPIASARVRPLLPAGLELGEQNVTPQGTHPVIFLFQRFFQCQFSVPLPIPGMNFHEHTVCVPYTYVRPGYGPPGGLGPYCFMPKLYLTDPLVLLGGVFVWGFDKEMAKIDVTERSYTVTNQYGRRVASLEWNGDNNLGTCSVSESHEFEPVRLMLHQRLISALPAGAGPWLVLTDFERRWNLAAVRPLQATMELTPAHRLSFQSGRYASGDAGSSAPGAYELRAPWYSSLPYYAMFPVGPFFRPAPGML
jgi:hypothetical protein